MTEADKYAADMEARGYTRAANFIRYQANRIIQSEKLVEQLSGRILAQSEILNRNAERRATECRDSSSRSSSSLPFGSRAACADARSNAPAPPPPR